MVSGGGKDRKVVLWGHDYSKKEEMEVMTEQEEMEEKKKKKTFDVKCKLIVVVTVPPGGVCVQVGESFGPVRALAEGKPGELFVGTTKNAIIRAAFPDTLTPIVQVQTPQKKKKNSQHNKLLIKFYGKKIHLFFVMYLRVTQMSCGVSMSILSWSSLSPAPRTNRFTCGTPAAISPCGARPSRWPRFNPRRLPGRY